MNAVNHEEDLLVLSDLTDAYKTAIKEASDLLCTLIQEEAEDVPSGQYKQWNKGMITLFEKIKVTGIIPFCELDILIAYGGHLITSLSAEYAKDITYEWQTCPPEYQGDVRDWAKVWLALFTSLLSCMDNVEACVAFGDYLLVLSGQLLRMNKA